MIRLKLVPFVDAKLGGRRTASTDDSETLLKLPATEVPRFSGRLEKWAFFGYL